MAFKRWAWIIFNLVALRYFYTHAEKEYTMKELRYLGLAQCCCSLSMIMFGKLKCLLLEIKDKSYVFGLFWLLNGW